MWNNDDMTPEKDKNSWTEIELPLYLESGENVLTQIRDFNSRRLMAYDSKHYSTTADVELA